MIPIDKFLISYIYVTNEKINSFIKKNIIVIIISITLFYEEKIKRNTILL